MFNVGRERVCLEKNYNRYNRMKKLKYILSVLLSALMLCSFTYDTAVFNEVKAIIRNYYVDKLPESIYNKKSIDDLLKAVNDPYTKYMSQDKFKTFMDNINNKHIEIGINIDKYTNGVKVTGVTKGSPADTAGIKEGDIIVSANGEDITGLNFDTQMDFIKKAAGSQNGLTVMRGNDYIQIGLPQKQVQEAAVISKVLDDHIGYIAITTFSSSAASDFATDLNPFISNKKIDSLIIDLRYNGGGDVDQALDIAGYFIGAHIALITRDRSYGEMKRVGANHNVVNGKKIVLLVNGFTASASEILAAALKDYGKAYIAGTKTYGKGCIQSIFQLQNKDILKVTTQRFFSPKGNAINKVGISPDLKVEGSTDGLKAAELLLNNVKPVKSNSGYLKIRLKNYGDVYLNIKKSITKDNWGAYYRIVKEASAQNSVYIGTGKGWSKVNKNSSSEIADLFYQGYKMLPIITGIDVNSEFRVKYAAALQSDSLYNNIQLIEESSGYNVPISTKLEGSNTIVTTPLENLQKGSTYYLVTYPTLHTAQKKPVGYGVVSIIKTRK